MKLASIYCENIDKLYFAVRSGMRIRDPKKQAMLIGEKYSQLLHHVSVFLRLENVNLFEAYCLKKISGDRFSWSNTYITTDDFPEDIEDDKKFKEDCDDSSKLWDEMAEDTDLKLKPEGIFLPIGMVQKDVLVEFTGLPLVHIFTLTPERIFFEFLKMEWNPDKDDESEHIPEEVLNNTLIPFIWKKVKMLLEDMMRTEFTTNDIVTPWVTNRKYYRYTDFQPTDELVPDDTEIYGTKVKLIDVTKTNYVTMSDVFTAYGALHFLEEDAGDINERLMRCKKIADEVPLDSFFETTRIQFIVNTPLYVFLELALSLPNTVIVDYEPLEEIRKLGGYLYKPKGFESYDKRIHLWLGKLLSYNIQEVATPNVLEPIRQIPLCTKISYTLEFTLEQTRTIVTKLIDDLSGGLFGHPYHNPTPLNTILWYILNEIVSCASTIAKTIYPMEKRVEQPMENKEG